MVRGRHRQWSHSSVIFQEVFQVLAREKVAAAPLRNSHAKVGETFQMSTWHSSGHQEGSTEVLRN